MSTSGSWILALDTGGTQGSLALAQAGQLVEQVELHSTDGFGHVVFSDLAALLERHHLAVGHLACIAAAAGPGSFTGIRVALAAAMGLAEAVGIPVLGVSSLQALAWHGTAALRAPYSPAGRGEVYGGLFDAAGVPQAAESVGSLDAFAAGLPPGAELVPYGPPLAAAVALLAWPRYLAGERPGPAALDANYVRRSDAELHWRDQ
jgi:tRNA threonylcarbamoyladenosine biosynthesis protein TsaB